MTDFLVSDELQNYLIAQGVGQTPNAAKTTPSATLPGIALAGRDGARLPYDGESATITIIDTGLAAPDILDAYLDETFIDVIVRARNGGQAILIHRVIRGLLAPIGDLGGRKLWAMAGLLVERSILWRHDQPMAQLQRLAGNDPHVTFDRVASYRFECRRKALAGQAYVP